MKKNLIIFSLMLVLCVCLFSGCGDVELGGNLDTFGVIADQFIKLEEWNSVSGLCYDKDTKIIYVYSVSGSFNGFATYSYSPYYVMDTNNNPTIGIYNGDN